MSVPGILGVPSCKRSRAVETRALLLPQPHARPAAVLGDELGAGGLRSSADSAKTLKLRPDTRVVRCELELRRRCPSANLRYFKNKNWT
jgi:hypothetical protein